MEEQNQPSLESWKDFAGDWIKAEHVTLPASLVCIGVESRIEDGKNKLIARVEYDEREWNFDLNKTNQNFVKSKELMPKELTGKTLVVGKIKVRNPSTNAQVDSLIIEDIQ